MKKNIKFVISLILFVMAFGIGCSTTKLPEEIKDQMIQGKVFQEETETQYITVQDIRYVFPEEQAQPSMQIEKSTAEDLVSEAAAKSLQQVSSSSSFLNSITQYFFEDGKIYDVITAPNNVTDIRLAPGESISGEAAIGDSYGWMTSTAETAENGRAVTHIYIKPYSAGMQTTMVVPTDQRTYYIRLRSIEGSNMVGVRWTYPNLKTFGASSQNTTRGKAELSLDPTSMNFAYKISGDNVWWKPILVFDDGTRTYIQFDPRFSQTAGAPALYFLEKQSSGANKAEIFNYTIRGNLYITDSVLRSGQAYYLMAGKNSVKITLK